MAPTGKFECLCKKVGFEVSGEPAMCCWCHCEACQVYGGDGAQVVVYKPEDFKFTKGESERIVYESAPNKLRASCATCGSFVNNVLPNGLIVCNLGGTKFEGERVKPTMHIW